MIRKLKLFLMGNEEIDVRSGSSAQIVYLFPKFRIIDIVCDEGGDSLPKVYVRNFHNKNAE